MDKVTNADAEDLKVLETWPPARPSCWGPFQWQALHQLLRGYPDAPSQVMKDALRAYLEALVLLIPCPSCAAHWKEIAPTVDTSSRVAVLKWSIDVHNAVNKRLNKPVLTYAEAVAALTEKCPGSGPAFGPRPKTLQEKALASAHTERDILIAIVVVLFVALVVLAIVLAVTVRKPSTSQPPTANSRSDV